MAAVAATLFGLIFLAISIAPEFSTTTTESVDRQVRATAAYVALLNPLMISLFALVPYQMLTIAVSVLSWVGILNTLAMSVTLLQSGGQGYSRMRNALLILISLLLYGMEAFVALRLGTRELDNGWLSVLADLMIFITLFGIVRAWELVGIRQFHIRDWFVHIVEQWIKRSKKEAGEPEEAPGKK
jgi:Kef-type K+ transport system membrane component KefB